MSSDDYERLTSHFAFDEPTLWFARAQLEADALVLTRWQITGRYRRRIPLDHIVEVDVPAANRLLLWLTSGRTLRLRMEQAIRWRRASTSDRPMAVRRTTPRSMPTAWVLIERACRWGR